MLGKSEPSAGKYATSRRTASDWRSQSCPADTGPAGGWPQEAHQNANQRRFARAVGPEEAEHFSGLDRQRALGEGRELAVLFAELVGFNNHASDLCLSPAALEAALTGGTSMPESFIIGGRGRLGNGVTRPRGVPNGWEVGRWAGTLWPAADWRAAASLRRRLAGEASAPLNDSRTDPWEHPEQDERSVPCRRLPAITTPKTALRDSRALLDAIIQSLPFRIWACDETGRCVLQNPISERDFGPFVGRLTSELPLPPESLHRWQESFQRVLAGEIVTAEAEIPVGGGWHVYRYLMAPIREAERIRGAVGVDIDITDLRRTERALAESEQRLRSVMENAPDIILQVSRDGRITYINRFYPSYDASQVIGSQAWDWVPPDYRGVVRGAIDRVFATGEPSGYETAGLGRDGKLAWYSTRISPVLLQGQVESAILICTDMTERQRSEAALRDSEERFRQLANSIDEGFWLIEVNPERPLFINPAFERIWGVPADQLYDRPRGGERWIHPEHRQSRPRAVQRLAGRTVRLVRHGVPHRSA